MGIKITADFSGPQRVFLRLREKLRNPRPLLEALQIWLARITRLSFEREASPEGVAWAPLKVSSLAAKARAGKGAQGLLRFSGALQRSLVSGMEGTVVFVGSPMPYAARHQYGFIDFEAVKGHLRRGQDIFKMITRRRVLASGKFGSARIVKGEQIATRISFVKAFTRFGWTPARPFLPSPETAEKSAALIAEEYLAEAVKE